MTAPEPVVERCRRELEEIVGAENLLTGSDEVAPYCRDTSEWHRVPAAVAFPATTAEVAELVRLANREGLAVWPFSKGKNWGYGASMARRKGALILMLDRMNRIVEVDTELAYAVIEPGVTQGQLAAHLAEHGLGLWADCTDATPDGSVLGNALERGIGYTPYWDHFGQLCGLEVVLPDGEVVRTGGAAAGARCWHTHKWGTGPFVDGLFSQANFGIVTRAGIWLMPEPEAFAMFLVDIEQEEDLGPVMDEVRRLALDRVLLSNVHIISDVLFLSAMQPYPRDRLADGETYLSAAARTSLRRKYRITPWSLSGGIYGTREQVRVQRKLLARRLGRFGRLHVLDDRRLRLVQGLDRLWRWFGWFPLVDRLLRRATGASRQKLAGLRQVAPIFKGVPGEFVLRIAYWKSRQPPPEENLDPARDGCGFVWFAAVSPLRGADLDDLKQRAETIFHGHGFDFAVTFVELNPRCALGLMAIYYDRNDEGEALRAQQLRADLAERLTAAGFPQYRTSVALYDRVMDPVPALQDFMDRLKRAVDPNLVLAPGRYGVGLTERVKQGGDGSPD